MLFLLLDLYLLFKRLSVEGREDIKKKIIGHQSLPPFHCSLTLRILFTVIAVHQLFVNLPSPKHGGLAMVDYSLIMTCCFTK